MQLDKLSFLFRGFKSPVTTGLFSLVFLMTTVGCDLGSSRIALKPVIKVNDTSLSVKDFSEELAKRLRNLDALSAKDPNTVQRAKDAVLQNFIFRTLILDYAKEKNIAIEDGDLEKEINAFRSSYPDDLSFRRVLAEENISFSDWKESLRISMIEKIVFKKISEKVKPASAEEVQRYYEENKNIFRRKERIYLRQIVLDDITKAQAARDELKKKDFADLAKKISVAPEAKQGGLVGWIERGSVDIFDKAFQLAVGGTSQVLESSYGFHIFKVERKAGPGIATLEEVRPLVLQSIQGKKEQAEFSAWLDERIRASKVLRDQALIDSVTVETRGKR